MTMAILRTGLPIDSSQTLEVSGQVNVPRLSQKPEAVVPSQEAKHENEWYRQHSCEYKVVEKPLHTPKPIHLIIVGAGAAGLNIAYKAERQFGPGQVTFSIYEKNEDVGGTWLENRYPGCTCDIPSHAYQWSFARKSDWSSYYSGSEEIWQYIKDWSVSSGIHSKVKFGHSVKEARWNEESGAWEVNGVDRDGVPWTDRGAILASCHGVLNTWKYPDIPGIDIFQGKLMHSAAWDKNYDLSGKTVAVIGGGSSAVQIIPSIQSKVGKLYPYLRSPAWITAGFGARYAAPGGGNFQYSERQKSSFEDPETLDQYGRDVEGELNKRFTLMHLHSKDQKTSREYVAQSMSEKLGNDPRLVSKLVPQFALGCRRMTPGSDYLQSLTRENVEVITESAVEITEDGIIDETGRHTIIDVIICATGFDVTRPSYDIVGRDNRNLGKEWAEFPQGYLSIMAEGFPNMFCESTSSSTPTHPLISPKIGSAPTAQHPTGQSSQSSNGIPATCSK